MNLDKDHDEDQLTEQVIFKLFPEENQALKAITKHDPNIFNYSHAVRIAIKQFIYNRLQELAREGIDVTDEEGRPININR